MHEVEVVGSDGYHGMPMDWSTIANASTAKARNSSAVGKTFAELAAERGITSGEAFCELLIADKLGPDAS